MVVNNKMQDHLEAVVELKKIIDPVLLKKVMSFIDHRAKKNLSVAGGLLKDIRNVKGYHLDTETPTNNFYWNYIKMK